MTVNCPCCRMPIAKEDRRRKQDNLTMMNGAKLTERKNEAPRVRCSCGHVTILLKGKVE